MCIAKWHFTVQRLLKQLWPVSEYTMIFLWWNNTGSYVVCATTKWWELPIRGLTASNNLNITIVKGFVTREIFFNVIRVTFKGMDETCSSWYLRIKGKYPSGISKGKYLKMLKSLRMNFYWRFVFDTSRKSLNCVILVLGVFNQYWCTSS